MTYLDKFVPFTKTFVLDREISSHLQLSRLTRCTRRTTRNSEDSTPEPVLPEADSLARNRFCTPNQSPMPMREHPDASLLERFMRGELSRASDRPECRKIVRHLLAGCPQCARITGPLWSLGDLPADSDRSDRSVPLSPSSRLAR